MAGKWDGEHMRELAAGAARLPKQSLQTVLEEHADAASGARHKCTSGRIWIMTTTPILPEIAKPVMRRSDLAVHSDVNLPFSRTCFHLIVSGAIVRPLVKRSDVAVHIGVIWLINHTQLLPIISGSSRHP